MPVCRHFGASAAAIATAAMLAGCGSVSVHHEADSKKTVHSKTSSGSGSVSAPVSPPVSASQAETDAENKVGSCIEGFYGNPGYGNISPSSLGKGLVKFQAVGDSRPDGSVTVQVNRDGTARGNNTLDRMGCKPGSYVPANDPNYDPTPALTATYDWTCSLAIGGADIIVTAPGNEPVQKGTTGRGTATARSFLCRDAGYKWGPEAYVI